MKEACPKESKCLYSQENYAMFTRSCDIYRREREIVEIQNKRNTTFIKSGKTVDSKMGTNAYTYLAQRANPIRNSNQPDNYRALDKKLIQLELNDSPKYLEQLKNLHSAEIHQTEAHAKLKEQRKKQRKRI